jgi:hypothetical protein
MSMYGERFAGGVSRIISREGCPMKAARWPLMVLALCASVGGSASASAQSNSDLQIPTTESGSGPERTAALNGRAFAALIRPLNNSTVTGTVTMTPGQDLGTTFVTVRLVGAAPGTYHWHLHVGTCDSPGALLGDRSQYQPITVGVDGAATIAETMALEPPSGGNYHIIIHQGVDPNNEGNVVACGTLLETGV